MSEVIDIQDPYWFSDDEELDEPEVYEFEPHCVDDCELCGCHGECDPEDPWQWADNHHEEMYEEADSVPYDEEEED